MSLNFPGLFGDRGLIEDVGKKGLRREDMSIDFSIDTTIDTKVKFNWGKAMVMC